MCGRVPCGGRGRSGRTSRRSKGARKSTTRSRAARSGRVRSEQNTQESTRLGPLVKMKNAGEDPALFDDAMTGGSRSVKPGDWAYVFEAQAGDLSAVGMEKVGG